jgi:hypothetical protein
MTDARETAQVMQGMLSELDALSSALAAARPADGARLLQLVGDRQRVLDSLAGLLATIGSDAFEPQTKRALHRAFERSSQLGELARRAVEQHARLVTRELQALDTLESTPGALDPVGRLDAEG